MFGRKKCKVRHDTLQIEKVQATRAMYIHPGNPESQEIEITLYTDDGEKLTLRLPSRCAPKLIAQLSVSYEAIAPRVHLGNWNAGREGMEV